DPELSRAVEEGIRRERKNAAWVFRGYMSGVAARLDTTEDEYLRERQADVLDVERRVLRYLRGGEPRAIANLREAAVIVAHELGANIELLNEVDDVVACGADGVGLFRTEFFYLGRLELPSEEEQYEAYRGVAERLNPRPVIFRTMDLGGDKVASYLGMTHETN